MEKKRKVTDAWVLTSDNDILAVSSISDIVADMMDTFKSYGYTDLQIRCYPMFNY